MIDAFDKPEYCSFNYGLCGWNNTGSDPWIWRGYGQYDHYTPISSFNGKQSNNYFVLPTFFVSKYDPNLY